MEPKMENGEAFQGQDHMLHGLIYGDKFRCAVVVLTETVREAQSRHLTDPLATIALGQTMVAASLAGSNVKEAQGYVSLSFQGNGPLRTVVAEYMAPGLLRGFAAVPQLAEVLGPDDKIPMSVGEGLGIGTITVRKSNPQDSSPYAAISVMVAGEIAEDMATYYLESEQIPTAILVGVDLDENGQVRGACGILIQKLGGATEAEDLLLELEGELGEIDSVSKLVSAGLNASQIFEKISAFAPTQVLEVKPLRFLCLCSRERMAANLSTLAPHELTELYRSVGKLEVTCVYCKNCHNFSLEEILKDSIK